VTVLAVRDGRVLRLWTDDVAAQVQQKLAERHPGQDLHRVVESIINRLKVARLDRQTIKRDQTHKRGRRIGI